MCNNTCLAVIPRAYFNISSQVAKTGSGVNITCMSESYPPATDVDNYQMKHPNNTPITKVLIPGGNGVVHIISAASKEQDAGEYLCTVHVTLRFLEYPDILLQSDAASAKLTVYGEFNIHNTYYLCSYEPKQIHQVLQMLTTSPSVATDKLLFSNVPSATHKKI